MVGMGGRLRFIDGGEGQGAGRGGPITISRAPLRGVAVGGDRSCGLVEILVVNVPGDNDSHRLPANVGNRFHVVESSGEDFISDGRRQALAKLQVADCFLARRRRDRFLHP